MKKFIYPLIALSAISLYSCKDDDPVVDDEYGDVDRQHMTLFRVDNNTGWGDEAYACRVQDLNDIYLAWFAVDGCAGYEIKMSNQGLVSSGEAKDWEDPVKILWDTIVGPDVLNILIKDLEYSNPYRFAIRTLDPRGYNAQTGEFDSSCEYHSKWYGYGNGRQWADYLGLSTESRYDVPDVVNITNRTKDSFRVTFDLSFATAGGGDESLLENFEVDDNGNFVAQILTVEASLTNPNAFVPEEFRYYELQESDYVNGYVDVTGLDQNSTYVVNLQNTNIPIKVDAVYNTMAPRTSGTVGEPKILYWNEVRAGASDTIEAARLQEYNCARIDTIFSNYMVDNTYAEGQIFELEGGKNYYFYGGVNVSKGFVLRTNPNDVAAGKRAKVFLSGIDMNEGSPRTFNFMFGRPKEAGEGDAPILVGDMVFEDIDFEVPLARNYGDQAAGRGSASGNYFANMHSTGMAVTFSSLQIRNCSFQGLIRGFFRVQGEKRKVFDNIIIDNNIFWNCMYYNNDGRGYAWVADDGKPATGKSNVFTHMVWTNNTFVDCPNVALFSNNNVNLDWPASVKYDITFSNNTVLNFSTRKTGLPIFSLRYVPTGSKITMKQNLFIQAKDLDDERTMYFAGADIRQINGGDDIVFDVCDNYGSNWDPAAQGDDAVFTSAAFSGSSNTMGKFSAYPNAYPNGLSELVVHASGLLPTELMSSPNPPNHSPDPDMHERANLNGLFYNSTPDVINSEVYQKNIGDQRWKRGTLW